MRELTPKWQLFFERIIPWFLLVILGVYSYAFFVQAPYPGFDLNQNEVAEIFVPTSSESLQVGDQLVRVGTVSMKTFSVNLRQTIFDAAEVDQNITLIVERNGQNLQINWIYPGVTRIQVLQRLNSLWWLPYVFWMAGTATLLFLRPRDHRWKLLIAFNYLTAVWLLTGSGPSSWHIWQSSIVLRSAIWLCLPVYLHFHWVFPKPLRQLPKVIWVILYSIGGFLAVAEWFQVLPSSTYFSGFFLALASSILLLIAHAIFQKANRREIGLLFISVTLTVIPPLGISVMYLFGQTPPSFALGGSLMALPALPGAYFFVAYRRQFRGVEQRLKRLTRLFLAVVFGGTATIILLSLADFRGNLSETTLGIGIVVTLIAALSAITGFSPFLALPALTGETISFGSQSGELEIRANRLLSLYLFAVFEGLILSMGIIITDSMLVFPGKTAVIGIGAALLGSIITAVGFTPFQRFVDRRILGIQIPPDELLGSYSERITTSLNLERLKSLIQDELLPSLLVRQSVLLRVRGDTLETVMRLGLEPEQLPRIDHLSELTDRTGGYLPDTDNEAFAWTRLVLPLIVEEQLCGLWLLGRRDPDDYYAPGEIDVLKTIANQTAIALVNIDQAERLRALYQTNVERHEQERASLARDLHDDVLNELAAITMRVDLGMEPDMGAGIQDINAHLRKVIAGLRPALLSHGLVPAIEQLANDLSTFGKNSVDIQFEIPSSSARYDTMIETHLYRILQQACENVLRHAQASTIRIAGECTKNGVQFTVADDGIGFLEADNPDMNNLLAENHYGLAGMFERAEIIGAELKIDSQPGEGTRVNLSWRL